MVRRAVFWAFFGQTATFVLSFAGSVVVARLLSPHELGVYAVATATLGILQIISSFGVAAYVVRETALDQSILDTAYTVNGLLAVALSALLVAASFPAANFLNEPSVAPVLQVLALTPLLGILEFRPSAMLQREMQFKMISLVAMVRTGASVAVTVLAAAYGASYLSPAYGSLAGAVVGLVGFLVFGRRYFSLRMSLRDWRPMAIFGVQMMSVSGVAVSAVRFSDIIMARLLGVATLGLYSRASNLSNLIFTNIYGTATRIIFAKLAQDFRERGVVRDTFLSGLRMICGLMGPILIGIAVLAKPLVTTIYGAKWEAAAPVLSLLVVAQFISLSFSMNWELFVVRNELKLQTKFEISRSIFGVVSKSIGCLAGIIGAAASSIVDALFSVWLYGSHMSRLADTPGRELMTIYGEATALTLIAVLPSAGLMLWFDWSSSTPLAYIGVAVIAGTAFWLLAIFRLGHPLADELKVILSFVSRKLRGEKTAPTGPAG